MLKIKDNVDLKELEKYGFIYSEGHNYDFYELKSKENIELTYFVDCDFRNISVSTYDGDEVELDNLLYDLIKADLVDLMFDTDMEEVMKEKSTLEYINKLQQENKQLKEQLENKIDLYEDTISYQLGFDKGKEYLQQRIDKAIECINENTYLGDGEYTNHCDMLSRNELLEILGDKENDN